MRTFLLIPVLVSLIVLSLFACERYEAPPTVAIDGLQRGLLFDSKAPLVLSFGQPVDVSTLNMKVARYDINLEGELGDEDDDPDTELHTILSHDSLDGDHGGHLEVVGDGSVVRFVADSALPVGPALVLLVEQGLTGTGGRVRTNRTRIPFAYAVRCTKGTRAEKLKSGVYFVLLDVDKPFGTQIQLYGAIDVDPATGAFVGQFTNADRNPDGSRCPTPCSAIDRCRLLPSPACVAPSIKAGTSDEYSDYVPSSEPPTGYSFAIEGCAVDDGSGSGVVTAPATMIVQSPPVTVEGLTMTAFFAPDPKGTVRATGSLTADNIYLNGNLLGDGKGKGAMTATLIPDGQVPQGVPRAPKAVAGGAVGADAGGGSEDAGR